MSQENNEVIVNDEANDYAEENLNECFNEFKKREHVYLACISSLEKEICQIHTYLNEWRSMHLYDDDDNKSSKEIININSLRNLLIDPSINLEIKELRQKIYEITRKCNLAEEKLQGCNFDAQTTAGQRLINKCKKLQEENYELGKTLEENNLQSLSIQVINLKQQIDFYKNELKILKELNADIDEDNELLSQQLAELTKKYTQISEEKNELEKNNIKLNNYIDTLKSKLSKYNEISKDEHKFKKKYNCSSNVSLENNANNEINNDEEEYAEENDDNDNEDEENDENDEKNEDYGERKEEDEEYYTNENDSYKKKNSDESKERKHRKLDKHYYKDKKYDKDKHKLREREKEKEKDKNRKDRTREKEKTKERIKEKLKEREKIKNKYKNRNKEKTRSKTKKEQYDDSNYSEQKRKVIKDHDNNEFREISRTEKLEHSNNISKNSDVEGKTNEYESERERSHKKKERSKNKYKEKYKSRKRIKVRSNDEKGDDDDAYDKKSNDKS